MKTGGFGLFPCSRIISPSGRVFDVSKTLLMQSSGPLAGLFLFKNQSVVQNSRPSGRVLVQDKTVFMRALCPLAGFN